MDPLNHFDAQGQAWMVNVGDKPISQRRAVAAGEIHMQAETLARIQAGSHHKGDVLGVARLAGIMAAKRTGELIPLCHPLPLSHVRVDFDWIANGVAVRATTETTGQTGVEMEALCAVNVALLTIYDMCKAMDRGMQITRVRLVEKRGGKSGHWQEDA